MEMTAFSGKRTLRVWTSVSPTVMDVLRREKKYCGLADCEIVDRILTTAARRSMKMQARRLIEI